MRRLHQASTSILATIILSTSLLSSCHSPEDTSSINIKPRETAVYKVPRNQDQYLGASLLYWLWTVCEEDSSFSEQCPGLLESQSVKQLANNIQSKPSKLSIDNFLRAFEEANQILQEAGIKTFSNDEHTKIRIRKIYFSSDKLSYDNIFPDPQTTNPIPGVPQTPTAQGSSEGNSNNPPDFYNNFFVPVIKVLGVIILGVSMWKIASFLITLPAELEKQRNAELEKQRNAELEKKRRRC